MIISMIKSIIECILYHLHNFRNLHTFKAPLEVLWYLIFICFLFSIFRSITLLSGLGIEDHSNVSLDYPSNDKGMPAIGVISITRWYLLTIHIICNGKFTLVLFPPCLVDHTSQYMNDYCVLVFLLFWSEELPKFPNISLVVLPCLYMLHFL